ncbi:MAG: DMT family transporter [Ferruginibacter sp.]
MAQGKFFNWFLFIILSIIWGSSFILMKEGLVSLSAYQVASLRIIFSAMVLLPTAIKNLRTIPRNRLGLVCLSGVLGSLLPAYLFCIAEEKLDSSLAGTLNSLTPIFVLLIGVIFFQQKIAWQKIAGITLAFTGTVLLFVLMPRGSDNYDYFSVVLIIIATICYGINVNMVHKYLLHLPSLHIAAVGLSSNALPALVVLFFTGFFQMDFTTSSILLSIGATAILGILGTALASILFYVLIKRAGPVFSSMVTYCIPIVAIFWGIIYGEAVGWIQVLCLLIILAGVYIANRKRKTTASEKGGVLAKV